jgi:hypothetical protein
VTVWAADPADLPSYQDINATLTQTDYVPPADDDDRVGGFSLVTWALQPPAGASAKCLGVRLRVLAEDRNIQYTLSSNSVLVNVTGNLPELDNLTISIGSLTVTTNSAPVSLTNLWVDADGVDPSVPGTPAGVQVTSQSGDVSLNDGTVDGARIITSGTIRSSSVISSSLGCFNFVTRSQSICGDLVYSTSGSGRVSVSQLLGAYNMNISTQHGAIVGANAGVVMGGDLRIASEDGKIYLNNFVQASGNETWISTNNDISSSDLIANKVYMNPGTSGKLTIVENYYGAANPGPLIKPQIAGNYTLPGLQAVTDRGDISILRVGGTSYSFADTTSVHLVSNSGDIKAEIDGGGVNAPYSLSSNRGKVVAELDGVQAGPTGTVGTGGSGNNLIYMHSDSGDVQMSVLASPF